MRPHLRDSETWCQTQKECEEQSVLEQTLQVGEQTWPNNPVRNGLHAVLSAPVTGGKISRLSKPQPSA